MNLKIYQVDAFASAIFHGNPAAVCPLEEWLAKEQMQNIAMENNLAETAFFVKEEEGYALRWFTPQTEVDLCGHATLASAHVLFEHMGYKKEVIRFHTNSGILSVRRKGDQLTMDFPTAELNDFEPPAVLEEALRLPPTKVYKDTDILYVVNNGLQLRNMDPDFRLLKQLNTRGVIVTAPGIGDVDFLSRFFAPAVGVDEDPVTGSAHTMLTPYWSKRLGKKRLIGRQISKRGGTVYCEYKGDRVVLSGEACTYLEGTILL
ncbi:PhzF family phenazine biosynthesis protein [Aliifodinibius salicampi]|uniref:PhzF family phenazine biosynthesis protein n=1 Tax=Fodinibius salicampi TaxID=1920655 RepID=A0ABT3PZ44_9BACT|nr:PhzF family phenazine biosynthesis protein [Fodinibius salicampi]MCW9713125.1 PhzF family phenazine biosynthesis protein [Fodinibius salicampi]